MMPWYLWIGIWIAGFVTAWRVGYSWKVGQELEKLEHRNRGRRVASRHPGGRRCNEDYCCGKVELNDHERTDYAVFSAIAAVFWPIFAIGFPAFLFATRPTRTERRVEQREADRLELTKLRKQAKELGLPFPEITDHR